MDKNLKLYEEKFMKELSEDCDVSLANVTITMQMGS